MTLGCVHVPGRASGQDDVDEGNSTTAIERGLRSIRHATSSPLDVES